MQTVPIQLFVPEGMATYFRDLEPGEDFERNAMLLFPLIRNCTISHGKAAEILGVHKTDLIEYYDALGIPYLDQSKGELLEDLETLERVMRSGQ